MPSTPCRASGGMSARFKSPLPSSRPAGQQATGSSNIFVCVRVRDLPMPPDNAPPLTLSVTDKVVAAHEPGDAKTVGPGTYRAVHRFPCDAALSSVRPELAVKMPLAAEMDNSVDVAPPQASQADVYELTAAKAVVASLEGVNSCVFAYGQTGSGKTYTLFGDTKALRSDPGVVPRCCDDLFTRLHTESARVEAEGTHEFVWDVSIGFFEIYNEDVTCLLSMQSNLNVRQDPKTGAPIVEGLKTKAVRSIDDVEPILDSGLKRRHTSATNMNQRSSRSHALFQLYVKTSYYDKTSKRLTERNATINLVDLAGAERQTATSGHSEKTAREGMQINLSLTHLAKVISDCEKRAKHVNYRNSKLTFLLKDNLGGNSQTFMIATVNPEISCYQETLSTLRYSQSVRAIRNNATVNQRYRMKGDLEAENLSLKKTAEDLRDQLNDWRQRYVSLVDKFYQENPDDSVPEHIETLDPDQFNRPEFDDEENGEFDDEADFFVRTKSLNKLRRMNSTASHFARRASATQHMGPLCPLPQNGGRLESPMECAAVDAAVAAAAEVAALARYETRNTHAPLLIERRPCSQTDDSSGSLALTMTHTVTNGNDGGFLIKTLDENVALLMTETRPNGIESHWWAERQSVKKAASEEGEEEDHSADETIVTVNGEQLEVDDRVRVEHGAVIASGSQSFFFVDLTSAAAPTRPHLPFAATAERATSVMAAQLHSEQVTQTTPKNSAELTHQASSPIFSAYMDVIDSQRDALQFAADVNQELQHRAKSLSQSISSLIGSPEPFFGKKKIGSQEDDNEASDEDADPFAQLSVLKPTTLKTRETVSFRLDESTSPRAGSAKSTRSAARASVARTLAADLELARTRIDELERAASINDEQAVMTVLLAEEVASQLTEEDPLYASTNNNGFKKSMSYRQASASVRGADNEDTAESELSTSRRTSMMVEDIMRRFDEVRNASLSTIATASTNVSAQPSCARADSGELDEQVEVDIGSESPQADANRDAHSPEPRAAESTTPATPAPVTPSRVSAIIITPPDSAVSYHRRTNTLNSARNSARTMGSPTPRLSVRGSVARSSMSPSRIEARAEAIRERLNLKERVSQLEVDLQIMTSKRDDVSTALERERESAEELRADLLQLQTQAVADDEMKDNIREELQTKLEAAEECRSAAEQELVMLKVLLDSQENSVNDAIAAVVSEFDMRLDERASELQKQLGIYKSLAKSYRRRLAEVVLRIKAQPTPAETTEAGTLTKTTKTASLGMATECEPAVAFADAAMDPVALLDLPVETSEIEVQAALSELRERVSRGASPFAGVTDSQVTQTIAPSVANAVTECEMPTSTSISCGASPEAKMVDSQGAQTSTTSVANAGTECVADVVSRGASPLVAATGTQDTQTVVNAVAHTGTDYDRTEQVSRGASPLAIATGTQVTQTMTATFANAETDCDELEVEEDPVVEAVHNEFELASATDMLEVIEEVRAEQHERVVELEATCNELSDEVNASHREVRELRQERGELEKKLKNSTDRTKIYRLQADLKAKDTALAEANEAATSYQNRLRDVLARKSALKHDNGHAAALATAQKLAAKLQSEVTGLNMQLQMKTEELRVAQISSAGNLAYHSHPNSTNTSCNTTARGPKQVSSSPAPSARQAAFNRQASSNLGSTSSKVVANNLPDKVMEIASPHAPMPQQLPQAVLDKIRENTDLCLEDIAAIRAALRALMSQLKLLICPITKSTLSTISNIVSATHTNPDSAFNRHATDVHAVADDLQKEHEGTTASNKFLRMLTTSGHKQMQRWNLAHDAVASGMTGPIKRKLQRALLGLVVWYEYWNQSRKQENSAYATLVLNADHMMCLAHAAAQPDTSFEINASITRKAKMVTLGPSTSRIPPTIPVPRAFDREAAAAAAAANRRHTEPTVTITSPAKKVPPTNTAAFASTTKRFASPVPASTQKPAPKKLQSYSQVNPTSPTPKKAKPTTVASSATKTPADKTTKVEIKRTMSAAKHLLESPRDLFDVPSTTSTARQLTMPIMSDESEQWAYWHVGVGSSPLRRQSSAAQRTASFSRLTSAASTARKSHASPTRSHASTTQAAPVVAPAPVVTAPPAVKIAVPAAEPRHVPLPTTTAAMEAALRITAPHGHLPPQATAPKRSHSQSPQADQSQSNPVSARSYTVSPRFVAPVVPKLRLGIPTEETPAVKADTEFSPERWSKPSRGAAPPPPGSLAALRTKKQPLDITPLTTVEPAEAAVELDKENSPSPMKPARPARAGLRAGLLNSPTNVAAAGAAVRAFERDEQRVWAD